MDASEIYSKRLNAKEVINLFFPVTDGTNQNPSRRSGTEVPPWYGLYQFKGRVTLIFFETQKGHDSFPDAGKRSKIFGPCQETSFTAITLNPESNFTRREKNHPCSTQIH